MKRRSFILGSLALATTPSGASAAPTEHERSFAVEGRLVDLIEMHTTTGKVMARFGVRFRDGRIPCIAFPDAWMASRHRLYEGAAVACHGDLANGPDDLCLVVRQIELRLRYNDRRARGSVPDRNNEHRSRRWR